MEIKNKLGHYLYLRFSSIWGHKFTSNHTDVNFVSMWMSDWAESLSNVSEEVIKSAIDNCKNTLEWPPSIAEFLKLCDRTLGIPSPQEAMQLAIRMDFSHPMVKAIFDRVGSWDMSHDKETVLLKKFEKIHAEELTKLRGSSLKLVSNTQNILGSDNL